MWVKPFSKTTEITPLQRKATASPHESIDLMTSDPIWEVVTWQPPKVKLASRSINSQWHENGTRKRKSK